MFLTVFPFTTTPDVNMDNAVAIPSDTADPWCTPCNPNQSLVRHTRDSDVSSLAMSMHRFLASVLSMPGCKDWSHTCFLADVSENLQELGWHALGHNTLRLALVVVIHVMLQFGLGQFLAVR